MNKFNRAKELFGSIDFSSESSADSVIYISSDEEISGGWDSDWSTDTEEMNSGVETQVTTCPVPIAGRRMTTASVEPGSSTSQFQETNTPKFDKKLTKNCVTPFQRDGPNVRWSCAKL